MATVGLHGKLADRGNSQRVTALNLAGSTGTKVIHLTTPPVHTAGRRSAELPPLLLRYRDRVGGALRSALSQDGSHVFEMLRYYMGWVDVDGNPCIATEGKALRPTLCLFACEAVGASPHRAMPAAVALELIHNFSLIHDDIQDHDETRHHRPTLWAVWGPPKALVAGNVLRVLADMSLDGLSDEGLEPDRVLAASSLLTEAYLEIIVGQHLDLEYEGLPDITMQDYLTMISLKTGALIRCALNLGAVIGTRDEEIVNAFRSCGQSLGYMFQIRDDLLGVWGDEEVTGKPVGADIRRKKNSFPLVYAMSQASPEDKQRLAEIYRGDYVAEDNVASVLNIMDAVKAREYAEGVIAAHGDRALDALAKVELSPEMRRELEDLVHFLLVRQC